MWSVLLRVPPLSYLGFQTVDSGRAAGERDQTGEGEREGERRREKVREKAREKVRELARVREGGEGSELK